MRFGALLLLVAAGVALETASVTTEAPLGPSTFVAAGTFPTKLFKHYYNNPTATNAQPQPIITDTVSGKVYPLSLTDPLKIPGNDTTDPHVLPSPASKSLLYAHAVEQITNIAASTVIPNNCAKCVAALEIAKFLVLAQPELGPTLAVDLCNQFKFSTTCANQFSNLALGIVVTQVVANADIAGLDGQMLCQNFLSLCPLPPTSPLNLDGWFAKPKPNPLPAPKKSSGVRAKVLHLSDIHLDPRFLNGGEANCTSGTCCRSNNVNTLSPTQVLLPAPRFGGFHCDTPLSLVAAGLSAIAPLTGTTENPFAFAIYTGDLVSHDPDNQLSRDYVEYAETTLYGLLRQTLGSSTPVYAALGNHDSYNQAQDAPHALGGQLADQFSWNYDHVASLWQDEGWLPESAIVEARSHYSGYSVVRADSLRIISLNTDFWYRSNYFNYINMTANDPSGMFRFVTDELQAAEDAGQRAWIMGHVLTGWDGSNPLQNPTNLFQAIVERFSPHVIAGVFFGHTHEDQFTIFYANNATTQSAETALNVAFIGPSMTPGTNLNSGFRVYEIDTGTFDILETHTWAANVSEFPSLEGTTVGPTYFYEYSARVAYGAGIPWGANDPLNGTWWHLVTEQMEQNPALVQTFTTFQGKSSVHSPPCTTQECVEAKICYMRSASAPIGKGCIQGFGSVQSGG